MALLEQAALDLDRMEELSRRDSPIHRLDPRVKLLTTLLFLVLALSLGKYAVSQLIPFFLYPVLLIRRAGLPAAYLFKRALIALPFAALIGLFNPWFDTAPLLRVGEVAISGGWVSFCSILLRGLLAVLTSLVLLSTTGFYALCRALGQLGLPDLLTAQLLFLYRYLHVLLEEADRMMRARALRSFGSRGMGLRAWGSLTGHLLLRAMERADRIHQSLLSRGFQGSLPAPGSRPFGGKDFCYVLGWLALFLLFRLYNFSALTGRLFHFFFS